jgi:hypothetical protein
MDRFEPAIERLVVRMTALLIPAVVNIYRADQSEEGQHAVLDREEERGGRTTRRRRTDDLPLGVPSANSNGRDVG